MKVALLGYGKMGKIIEQVALSRGHEIVIKATKDTKYNLTDADVAIDFSVPSAAVNNISNGLKNNVPVVSGTTGWLDNYEAMVKLCNEHQGAFLYASNFSLGVNIFFELNSYLAKIMSSFEQYKVTIEEIHHTQKLDKPSGTAITLAQGIIKEHTRYTDWELDKNQTNHSVPVFAKRLPEVPGTHTISYSSAVDTIAISHEAHNREGFALGAVLAAEWILGKKGVFSMKDVLNIG
ncbi:MAG TPA: 4-hydroxy-tetrahydrodipicolinate reductase [Mangrovimonas sp.]|nr:4-hydroxy-tetrahydrodipicolinate reductase [Mangrovimonas sp.]